MLKRMTVGLLVLVLLVSGCKLAMTQEERNKSNYMRLVEETLNNGNLAVVDELVSPNYCNRTDLTTGCEAFRARCAQAREAFPDLKIEWDRIVADGDTVAATYTIRGTNTGSLFGLAPTGERVICHGTWMARFEQGRVVEEWGLNDQLGVMMQVGAFTPLPDMPPLKSESLKPLRHIPEGF